ncbi:MAG TPA: hypothetical protein VLT36_13035 [Candidatus Dormibacteraeota bacterium]|nr:hypothetical protein [Candidatus Dormibacteraeota bacterium]
MKTLNAFLKIHPLLVLACSTCLVAAQPTEEPRQPREPEPPSKPAPRELENRKQIGDAEGQAKYAHEAAANGDHVFKDRLAAIIARPGIQNLDDSLVIPKDGLDLKAAADTEDDLNVMAHILEKSVNSRNEGGVKAMGIVVHGPFGSGGSARNLYIEGYGALFFLDANFPLVPPSSKQDSQEKSEPNSEWEQARREMHEPPAQNFNYDWGNSSLRGPSEKYSEEKVENLKRNIASALKNAAHIRRLKGDENVVVVVYGRSQAAVGGRSETIRTGGGGFGGGGGGGFSVGTRVNQEGKTSKLIIRAKKSEIESFQKDKLSLDEFRNKLNIQIF